MAFFRYSSNNTSHTLEFQAGYPALALHGGMDQYDRDSVLNDYKKGLSNLLIGKIIIE